MKKLVAGNWKMNGLLDDLSVVEAVAEHAAQAPCDVLLCLPATLIGLAKEIDLPVGAQDCHTAESGAHTGDLSAKMLANVGACAIIVGHSERRQDHAETDALIQKKLQAVWSEDLQGIVCIGETREAYEAGQTLEVLTRQLDGSLPDALNGDTVIAYEPVWAIGTGLTPTLEEIEAVHTAIHTYLLDRFGQTLRILYGGSVKPDNAKEIFALTHVSGALVGGASLKAKDFCAIIDAAA
jgi:triosephosphate isomerase (TIM)